MKSIVTAVLVVIVEAGFLFSLAAAPSVADQAAAQAGAEVAQAARSTPPARG